MFTLVEINSTRNGAFAFKVFKGKDSTQKAERFCKELPKKCKTLKAFIRKAVNY